MTVTERRPEAPKITNPSDRSFGLVFASVFGIAGFWFLIKYSIIPWFLWGGATFFLLCAFFTPKILAPLNRIWTHFGKLLHHYISPVIIGLIYFLVITPFALFFRLVGNKKIAMKFDPSQQSYWIYRDPPGPAPDTMKQQF